MMNEKSENFHFISFDEKKIKFKIENQLYN